MKLVTMAIILITTDAKETVFQLRQMVIVISTLNQTSVQSVVRDFEKIPKHVTMESKETIKDVLLTANLFFLVGHALEVHQLVMTFAKNVETEYLKELKYVMTTT